MTLSETWFIEGYIDFELQKYRLLAYLQEVQQYFSEKKLYPQLSDVIFHYNNLTTFRENKRLMQDMFLKQLDAVHLEQLQMVYSEMLADDDVMQELEKITLFGLSKMKGAIEAGAQIYELVESNVHIEPIGIVPLYKNEGYLLLRYGALSEIRAYNYNITLFEHGKSRYRALKMHYVDKWQVSIVNTFESVKRDIVHYDPLFPNPAVYAIDFPLQMPLDETLLPVAKRMLVKYIESGT
jgi:hypothetical protein